MKQYDAIIIGFGKAGKTLAAELSNRGWQVAIVERSNMMYGGSCPNIACIPTKTLIHEAGISSLLYYEDFPKQSNMYKQAVARKNRLTSFLRGNNYERLSKRPNVTIYTGSASFISPGAVKVTLPDGDIELQGKEIFINTGSTPNYSGNRRHSAKPTCVHQYHAPGYECPAQTFDYCRRRIYRVGICFDVCRIRQ